MATRSPADALGFRVLRSLRRILRQVDAHSRGLARDTGLTVPQLLCMRAILEREGHPDEVTVAAVADAVGLSRSTVSGVVDRLVRAGLVARPRSDRDRRRLDLRLTDDGRARVDAMPRPLQDRFLARLAALPDDEQARLLDALERVVNLMDADDLEAAPMLTPGVDVDP